MSEENNNNNNEDSDDELEKKIEAQQKEIEEQCDKLVSLIKSFEGCKSDAAFHCCFDLVIWGGSTHFESLGIITELQHAYRNASFDALKDEEDENDDEEECLCPDCSEEKTKEKKVTWN